MHRPGGRADIAPFCAAGHAEKSSHPRASTNCPESETPAKRPPVENQSCGGTQHPATHPKREGANRKVGAFILFVPCVSDVETARSRHVGFARAGWRRRFSSRRAPPEGTRERTPSDSTAARVQ
jgi:hypothetical protein